MTEMCIESRFRPNTLTTAVPDTTRGLCCILRALEQPSVECSVMPNANLYVLPVFDMRPGRQVAVRAPRYKRGRHIFKNGPVTLEAGVVIPIDDPDEVVVIHVPDGEIEKMLGMG